MLVEHVEHRLFKLGAIAPADAVSAGALRSLGGLALVNGLDGETLVQHWANHVDARIHQFIEAPLEFDGATVQEFLERCAVVFGVESERSLRLLDTFHRMPETQRFGIFVKLLRSPHFGYLKREIAAMPVDEDVEADDPQESMRALMRSLTGESC